MSYRDYTNFTGLHGNRIEGHTSQFYFFGDRTAETNEAPEPRLESAPCGFIFLGYHIALELTLDALTWPVARNVDPATFYPDAAQTILELDPPPDFVQIELHMEIAWLARQVCPGPVDAAGCITATIDMGGVEFPYGVTETTLSGPQTYAPEVLPTDDPIIEAGGHVHAYDWNGILRRDADELTYEGNVENDAVDSLIPWSVFIANPTLVLGAETAGAAESEVNALRLLTPASSFAGFATATPWWRNETSIIDAVPGDGGIARLGHGRRYNPVPWTP